MLYFAQEVTYFLKSGLKIRTIECDVWRRPSQKDAAQAKQNIIMIILSF